MISLFGWEALQLFEVEFQQAKVGEPQIVWVICAHETMPPKCLKKNKAGEDLQRQCLHETNVSDWLHSGFEQLWYKRLLNF